MSGIQLGNNIRLYLPEEQTRGAYIVVVQQDIRMLEVIADRRSPDSPNRVAYTHRPIIALDLVEIYPIDLVVTGGTFYNKFSGRGTLGEALRNLGDVAQGRISEKVRDETGKDRVGIPDGNELAGIIHRVKEGVLVVNYSMTHTVGGNYDLILEKNMRDMSNITVLLDAPDLCELLREGTREEKRERLLEKRINGLTRAVRTF